MQQSATPCPPDVLELLPWYPDDGLSDAERGAVEAHAAECAECRREIHDAFGDATLPDSAPPPERVLARVFDRIAAGGGAATAAPPAPGTRPQERARPRTPTPAPRRARVPIRWSPAFAAAAGAAAAVLVTLLGVDAARRLAAPGVYVTATAPPAAEPAAAGASLDVVLRGDAPSGRVAEALQALGAEIVSGPSDVGRYRIRLPVGADASAAAIALRADGTGVASFAEPVR